MHKLSYYLISDRFPLSAALPFPLPLLSLLLKFNRTQQFLVPPTCLHSHSHDMQHDHLLSHPASTSFFTQFFFFPVFIFGQAVRFFLHDIDRKQTGPIHSFTFLKLSSRLSPIFYIITSISLALTKIYVPLTVMQNTATNTIFLASYCYCFSF